MASALFNTFHSLNTSASVFPVLRRPCTSINRGQDHKQVRSQEGEEGRRNVKEEKTRTGLRNTSLDWKKALLAIGRHHFLLLQCWDLQSLHLQITKTKIITARRMPCVANHPLTDYHQTRQDKAKYYLKGHPPISALKFEFP